MYFVFKLSPKEAEQLRGIQPEQKETFNRAQQSVSRPVPLKPMPSAKSAAVCSAQNSTAPAKVQEKKKIVAGFMVQKAVCYVELTLMIGQIMSFFFPISVFPYGIAGADLWLKILTLVSEGFVWLVLVVMHLFDTDHIHPNKHILRGRRLFAFVFFINMISQVLLSIASNGGIEVYGTKIATTLAWVYPVNFLFEGYADYWVMIVVFLLEVIQFFVMIYKNRRDSRGLKRIGK